MDEFKIRPNVTLNAGLRYEYYGVDYDKNNIGLVFDPFTCGLQYCPPGTSFYFPNTKDFGPRVSIAWALGVARKDRYSRRRRHLLQRRAVRRIVCRADQYRPEFQPDAEERSRADLPVYSLPRRRGVQYQLFREGPPSQGCNGATVDLLYSTGDCPHYAPGGYLRTRNPSLPEGLALNGIDPITGKAAVRQPDQLHRMDHRRCNNSLQALR